MGGAKQVPVTDVDARSQVLGTLRRALGASRATGTAATEPPTPTPTPTAAPAGVEARMASAQARIEAHPRSCTPERATRSGSARIGQFIEMVGFSLASIEPLAAEADIPGALATLCAARGLPAQVVLPGDNRLRALDWARARVIAAPRLVRSGDAVAVALADGGIAETGTLALLSGPASPSTSNFLPEHHVIVVQASRIHAGYEDYWSALRRETAELPRTVNWITGPSRSGDIELRMLMGAHGPLSVHVLLVQDEPG